MGRKNYNSLEDLIDDLDNESLVEEEDETGLLDEDDLEMLYSASRSRVGRKSLRKPKTTKSDEEVIPVAKKSKGKGKGGKGGKGGGC